MFGNILKIYDDHVIIENKSRIIDTNYLNLYVIFSDNEKKVVGEIVNIEVNMNEKQCGNKAKVEDNTTTNKKENGSTIYVPLKEKSDFEKLCSNEGKIFEELDDEFIENININLKGCNKNCN